MRKLSLRFKMMVLVVLISGGSLFVVGISNYSSAKQRIVDSLKETANEKVRLSSCNLSAWIGNRISEVEIMSRTEQVRSGTDAQRIDYFRKEVERSKGIYRTMEFVDLKGDIALSSEGKSNIRSKLNGAMIGESIVFEPFIDKATNQRLITLQVPVFDERNNSIGFVHSEILLDTAFKKLINYQSSNLGQIMVTAADGTAFYWNDVSEAKSISKEAIGPILTEIAKDPSEMKLGYRELSNKMDPQILFFSAVEGTAWYVVLQVPIDELEKPLNSLFWKTMLSIAATELIMIWLLTMAYNRQLVRVRKILSVTETVAEGNFNLPPIPISNHDEIGALTQSVNGMMAHLKTLFERLDTIINQNDFLMIAFDSNYKITYFSKTAEIMLGYTAEEVLNKATPLLYIAPDEIVEEAERLSKLLGRTVTPDLAVLRELRSLDFSYDRDWTFVRKDGKRFPVAHNSNGLRDRNGSFIGVVAIARDITEQRRVRQELVQAKMEADEANLAKSRFLAGMSHEIRTPLNGIIGLTQLMQKTDMTEVQKDYSSKVLYSSQALLRIINDILDFSKVEAGKLEIERITFHPEELLDKLSGILGVFLGGKEQFELMIETDETLPVELIGDPLRLEQVLLNLCNNAVKFTEKGFVKIKVDMVKEMETSVHVRFSVEDTGIGISKEQLDSLFKPFTQADGSTSRKYGGTGLGLVIASSFIKLMDSNLEVLSELGQGSVFSFTVPMLLPLGSRHNDWKSKLQNADLRVLVVEDHPVMQEHVSALLRSFSLEPIVHSTWKEAVAELRRLAPGKPYDMALMDMDMPDMYGMETWAAFKQEADAAGIITLALTTAYGRDEMLNMPTEYRPEGIVVKPFSRLGLFQSIEAVWGRHGSVSVQPFVEKNGSLKKRGNSKAKRILLAEDNEINQQVAMELLAQCGYSIEVARTGYEVLDKFHAEDWDLLLMDIFMPELDGVETTRRIRSGDHLSHIPIIALTANVISDDHEQYRLAGMNDIITKPIDLQMMESVIRKWLGEAAVSTEEGWNQAPSTGNGLKEQLYGNVDINVSKALHQLLGKEPILLKMFAIFLRDYEGYTERIKAALREGHLEEAQRFAHTLKGAAGSLSADPLFEAAAQLEENLKGAIITGENSAGLVEAIEELDIRLERLILTLRTIS
ncbi:response regulator [Paenibacillus sp. LMG 31456]|uniref:Circadian input-output histidine kinase CikA n=1 Tax=Paenibacillus foliorum TaxID=2654974 RepID=A0A972GXV7_9BACL|nr:response regulator [Paenibacillus foliorum]NOU96539.1 response regulator [Paenibacillus foliorum]